MFKKEIGIEWFKIKKRTVAINSKNGKSKSYHVYKGHNVSGKELK